VGNDQFQHIEMAVDIAESFNYIYSTPGFVLPAPLATEQTKTVVGLDGRKMSKSYNNTIPLFAPEKELKKLVMRIVTNSQTMEEPKDPETCNIFSLYKHFAEPEQISALKQRYESGGMGWGHAKTELFSVMNEVLTPLRIRYESLMQNKDYIDELLIAGAVKARELAAAKIKMLRKIIGMD
jgi:tryptophanyl-tRNA synthetase